MPRAVACGKDFTIVSCYPYTGPSAKELAQQAEEHYRSTDLGPEGARRDVSSLDDERSVDGRTHGLGPGNKSDTNDFSHGRRRAHGSIPIDASSWDGEADEAAGSSVLVSRAGSAKRPASRGGHLSRGGDAGGMLIADSTLGGYRPDEVAVPGTGGLGHSRIQTSSAGGDQRSRGASSRQGYGY